MWDRPRRIIGLTSALNQESVHRDRAPNRRSAYRIGPEQNEPARHLCDCKTDTAAFADGLQQLRHPASRCP